MVDQLDRLQAAVAGRYRIERRLGAGGMGVVYEAYDRTRERSVALKTLYFDNPDAVYRLKKEFRTLADVAHPNPISLYELVGEDDIWYFTMELIHGETFQDYVRPRAPPTDRGVPSGEPEPGELHVPRLRSALRQLARGVHYLHEAGKWHLDLKPSNVLVTGDGRVVILDFGISGQHQEERGASVVTRRGLGTVAYMAPEQAGAAGGSAASDWYAVGVMLYEALTARLPFDGVTEMMVIGQKITGTFERPLHIAPGAPVDLATLCTDLLVRDPEQRPTGQEILRRLGSTEPVGEATPRPARRIPTILGRGSHLAALEQAFGAACQGQGICVYVHGPSGIGKSTLVEHFLTHVAAPRHAVVLPGRCSPRESVPYKAFDSVIDNLTRYLRSLPRAQAAELLPPDILELARVFPVLTQVEAVAGTPARRSEIPDALELRKRAFAALRELLARMAQRHPLVIYIDDLQWADIDSVALLDDLLRQPTGPPLLLVSCFRSEEEKNHPLLAPLLARAGTESCRDLPVGPLGTDEATELALLLLGGGRGDAVVRSIVEEAAGSPFVLEQLAQHVVDSGAGEMDKATLAEMLEGRICRSPPGTRELLEVLAVAKHPVDFEVAHRAAGISGDPRALASALEIGRLIRSSTATDLIEIYHDRIREGLGRRLSRERECEIHWRLAEAIRNRGIDDPEALFEHYLASGHTVQAAEQAAKAARRAMGALAFDRAARFFRHALELEGPGAAPPRLLLADLGEALANAGRPAEAADAFLNAKEGRDPATALELQRRAAEQLLFGGHIDRGLQVFRDLLRAVGLTMATSRNRTLFNAGLRMIQLRLRGVRYVERKAEDLPLAQLLRMDVCGAVGVGLALVDTLVAFDFVARYLLMALDAGEITRVSRGMAWESGFVAIGGGRTRRLTERLTGESTRLAERLGRPPEIARAMVTTGAAALLCGEFRRAVDILAAAVRMLQEQCTGMMWELTTSQSFLLSSLIYVGELQEAGRRLPLMLSDALERGNLLAATEARAQANFVWVANDDVARAQSELDEALRSWSHRGFHRQHLSALVSQSNIELYAGNPEAAWRRVADQWGPLKRSLLLRVQILRVEANYLFARCALAAAAAGVDRDGLLRFAERHAAPMAREHMPWIAPFAPLLRAGIDSVRGDDDGARRQLAVAAEGFDRADMRLYAAAARRHLGALTGGSKGLALVVQADGVMRSQGVPRPDRLAAVMAPGFAAHH
jgi:eukaryotic-like serine/threonine-protein kinase